MYLHVPDITIHSVRKISGRILDGFPIWGLDPSHGFWAPENWIPPAGLYLVTMGEHWPNIARQSRQKSRCSWSPVARPRWFQMIPMARYMVFFVDEDWCFSALQRAFGFKGAFGICVEHIWNVFRIWRSPTNWDIQLFWDDNNHCEEPQFWIVLEAHACASMV
jgi:hypothetical protein